jgi:ubiquinone/menaquinone biosynthesis C-methylase UbiE
MAEVEHPLFARVFDRYIRGAERTEQADHRRRMLAGLSGRVVEVGAGNGMNFRHYPAEVSQVVAVEPEPYLRGKAAESARTAAVDVRVVEGVADALPVADGEFDAAVASLVLCSVPDQGRALAELRRVLKAGGELRFYEHVRAQSPRMGRLQDASELVWPRVAGGCHMNRDTVGAIERAGFAVEDCQPVPVPPQIRGHSLLPHVLGVARRVADTHG